MDFTTSNSQTALKIELERIEALLARANALASAAAAPGGTFAGPIVANEAAASALTTLVEGEEVRVLTTMDIYRFEANSTVALNPHVVLASASPGASPRLFRTFVLDPAWREGITDVYIDPSNVTGIANDENRAIFNAPQVGAARQPLLTWQELLNRWGRRETITTGDLVNLTFQIHVLSNEPALTASQDPCDLDFVCGVDTFARMLGEASTTVFGPIALTTFTAQNPAVPAPGGTAAQISIGATVWGPFLGKRMRRVSDGSIAYVLKDQGAGSARISNPALTNEPLFFDNPTTVVWAPGDLVVVEDLVNVHMAATWLIGMEGSAFGFGGQTNVTDINIMISDPVNKNFPFVPKTTTQGDSIVLYQSTSDRGISLAGCVIGNDSCIRDAALLDLSFGGQGAWFGGAIVRVDPVAIVFVEIGGVGGAFGNFGCFDFFAYIQTGALIARSVSVCGAFAVWDTPAVAFFNPGGHAVLVGGGSNITAAAGFVALRSGTPIWGTGALGMGVRVQAGSKISQYAALPNITGTTGDFQLGDSVVGWWWNPATGVYNPVGAGNALSWANLTAPGLFAGSAHEPAQDAHINKAAAT